MQLPKFGVMLADGCPCGGIYVGYEKLKTYFSVRCPKCHHLISGLRYYCGKCGERPVTERGRWCAKCQPSAEEMNARLDEENERRRMAQELRDADST